MASVRLLRGAESSVDYQQGLDSQRAQGLFPHPGGVGKGIRPWKGN